MLKLFQSGLFNHCKRQSSFTSNYILKLFIVIDKLDGFKRFLVTIQL